MFFDSKVFFFKGMDIKKKSQFLVFNQMSKLKFLKR